VRGVQKEKEDKFKCSEDFFLLPRVGTTDSKPLAFAPSTTTCELRALISFPLPFPCSANLSFHW
jgi:hypothetical protein